ncbi:MAG: hypothetical protein FRX49_10323 [Trebouxia sp. A1-2]|nr:MAG: hypothetical protein FRX49_10323 [Trebouxia sp. A1-2]
MLAVWRASSASSSDTASYKSLDCSGARHRGQGTSPDAPPSTSSSGDDLLQSNPMVINGITGQAAKHRQTHQHSTMQP